MTSSMGTTPRLFHGGVPDLRPGDLIEPGHDRLQHDGCPWCEARANGEAYLGLDGPALHDDRVYATTNRVYAKMHASLWGRGDLYRVEPVGTWERSTEDSIETYTAPASPSTSAGSRRRGGTDGSGGSSVRGAARRDRCGSARDANAAGNSSSGTW